MTNFVDLSAMKQQQEQGQIQAKNMRAVVTAQFQVGILGPWGMLIQPLPEFRDVAAINPWEHADGKSFHREVDGMWTRWRLGLDGFMRSEDFSSIASQTTTALGGHAAVIWDAWSSSE